MQTISGSHPQRQTIEIIVGVLVLATLVLLLALAIAGRYQRGGDAYDLQADFNQIDGLTVGSDVRLSGITVGHVTAARVNTQSYRANVTLSIDKSIALPTDSGAVITSDSLLGGKYIALSPGGDTSMLAPGQRISVTQGSISLEQLLSKFIFSVTDSLQNAPKSGAPSGKLTP